MTTIPVSVLMSTYSGNKAKYLNESLNSIAEQSYIPEEIILIIDGEVDREQLLIISQFEYEGDFRTYFLEENHGLAYCMNLAIEYSTKEILTRMDADDICYYKRFELEYNKLISLKNDNSVVCAWHSEFNINKSQLNNIKKTPETCKEIKKVISYRNIISHPTIMTYKQVFKKYGSYNESVGLLEDYELHLRLIYFGVEYYCIQQPLVYVRTDVEQYSRRGGIKYLINEYKFRFFCYRHKYISSFSFILSCFIYSFMRLSPVRFRKFLYKFVRKSLVSK